MSTLDNFTAAGRSSINLKFCPMAFGELLQFMYYGKIFDKTFDRNYAGIDEIEVAIDVCRLADMWNVPELFNHSIQHIASTLNDNLDNLLRIAEHIYDVTSKGSPLRNYVSMRVALFLYGIQTPGDGSFFRIFRHYLGHADNFEADRYFDYHLQQVKVIERAVNTGNVGPLPVAAYFMEVD